MKTLQIKVKPHARASTFQELADGSYLAQIKAAPVDGKANEELVALVAQHFQLPRTQVRIKSGASGRTKWVVIPKQLPA